MTTKLYIDSGWYCVPYESITYNEEGKKVAYPPTKWRDYRYNRCMTESPAGAVICGQNSGVVVIDCDTMEAVQHVLSVARWDGIHTASDLEGPDVADKIGLVVKTSRGVHFYFAWEPELDYDVKGPKTDVQATENKLVYLATTEEASQGKHIVACNRVYEDGVHKIKLHNMPDKLKEWCVSLRDSKEETEARKTVRFGGGVPLAKVPIGTHNYLRRVTPKSFRSDPHYRALIDKRGYLHPDDIRDGDGNDYIIAVAGIMASDPTIDYDAFFTHLEWINDQWTNPLSQDALRSKVMPYALGKYEGCPFNYDEDWEKAAYSFTDVDGNGVTIAYDLLSGKFVIGEHEQGRVMLKSSTDVVNYYTNRTGVKMQASTIASFIPGVNVTFDPLKPFGLHDKTFNTYKHSKYVDILNEHEANFSAEEIEESKHCVLLPFFEHLFREQTGYWLSFLKRKLTTFEYSATTFCLFDSRGGAGKGALQTLLATFVGDDKVGAISQEAFRAKFTAPYEGKLFVFHNEYSDEPKARASNTDLIKERTGSPLMEIERKGSDPYKARNMCTFFVTSNRISVELKDGDRRFCVSNCDMKFDDVFGGMEHFYKLNSDEAMTQLAIYLKTCVTSVRDKDYMQPPTSQIKEAFVELTMTRPEQFVKAVKEHDWFTVRETGGDKAILAQHNLIDLTAVADHMELNIKVLTRVLKLSGLSDEYEIKKDTNKKYRLDKYIQFLTLPRNATIDLLVKDIDDSPAVRAGIKV